MNFLPEDLNDVTEPKAAPTGTYRLQITGAELGESGERSKHPGSPLIRVTIGFPDEPDYLTFRHYISLPFDGDENAGFKLLMLKRFLTMFGITYTPDVEELVMSMPGSEAQGDVQLGEPNEDGAVYNSLRVPRMREEPVTKGRRRK